MVKRRERRVGGCDRSIVEECIWSKRRMKEAERLSFGGFAAEALVRLPLPTPLRCQRQLRRRRRRRVSKMTVKDYKRAGDMQKSEN